MAFWIKIAAVGHLVAGNIETPVAGRRVHGDNRILNIPRGFNPHLENMDRILIDWGLRKRLTRRQMRLIYFNRWKNGFYDYDLWKRSEVEDQSAGPATRFSRKAAYLIKKIGESPSMLFSHHFYYFLFCAVRGHMQILR
jgi:hypothetical protein